MSQTSFDYISTNFLTILMVSMVLESPKKEILINTSHILRQSILAKLLSKSVGNHHGTTY